ncbi:MAG: PASTA domain-containing protein, partial [Candidatus Thermochlorobacter sp.]
ENELIDAAKQIVIAQGVDAGKRMPIWSKVPLTFSDIETKDDTKRMPLLIGLRADRALYEAGRLGLRLEIAGKSGKVVAQSPKAGERVKAGQVCLITMQ